MQLRRQSRPTGKSGFRETIYTHTSAAWRKINRIIDFILSLSLSVARAPAVFVFHPSAQVHAPDQVEKLIRGHTLVSTWILYLSGIRTLLPRAVSQTIFFFSFFFLLFLRGWRQDADLILISSIVDLSKRPALLRGLWFFGKQEWFIPR